MCVLVRGTGATSVQLLVVVCCVSQEKRKLPSRRVLCFVFPVTALLPPHETAKVTTARGKGLKFRISTGVVQQIAYVVQQIALHLVLLPLLLSCEHKRHGTVTSMMSSLWLVRHRDGKA